jgi:hypothetical protein
MTEKINWSLQVRVAHGPQIAATGVVDVEAYDKVSVEIAAGESQQVDLVPAGTERVALVLIVPATPSPDLSYEIDGTAIALDGAHAFFGAGAARLLGADPASLTFTNDTADPARLDILLGRDVTP